MENVRTSIMQCILSTGPITKFACSIIVDISSFIIEFKFVKKVRTVYELLKERDCMGILKHPDIITATTAIIDRSPHTPTLILVSVLRIRTDLDRIRIRPLRTDRIRIRSKPDPDSSK